MPMASVLSSTNRTDRLAGFPVVDRVVLPVGEVDVAVPIGGRTFGETVAVAQDFGLACRAKMMSSSVMVGVQDTSVRWKWQKAQSPRGWHAKCQHGSPLANRISLTYYSISAGQEPKVARDTMDRPECEIGIVGLGVMGRNLLLNLAEHGFPAAGYDLETAKVQTLLAEAAGRDIRGAASPAESGGAAAQAAGGDVPGACRSAGRCGAPRSLAPSGARRRAHRRRQLAFPRHGPAGQEPG